MGVKGLGSFLKDNRGSLCRSIQLPTGSGDDETVKVVVDAWSILFPLYLSSLPWQSGGEYLRYYRIVCRLIESWRNVGLEPIFVFDGASPPEKHSTLLHRLNEQLNTARLFYTTSPSSRSAPSFSRNQVLLPPMTYHTMVQALHEMGVKSHHVPIGEADGFVVALAETLGAYILSQDSDYLILMSNAGLARVKGYCPLDMISWIEGDSAITSDETATDNDPKEGPSGEWEVAQPRRETFTPRQSHLLPSPHLSNSTLLLTYVPPTALRTRLRLPPSVMPLLASLCGNDYTPANLPETLFEAGLKASARIEKVARVIRETLYAPSGSSSPRLPNGGAASSGDVAVELVRKLIKKLAIRDFSHDGALQLLVEGVIEATFQYTLPLDRNCCDQYPFCGEMESGCSTRPPSRASSISADPVQESWEVKGKRAYAEAAGKGYAGSMAHVWAYPGRMYLWNVLEDPNGTSLKGGEGSRGLRSAAWGFAEEALGGLCWPPPTSPPEESLQNSQEDAGEMSAEHATETDGKTETSDEVTLVDGVAIPPKAPATPPREVVEYVRQANRNVPIPNTLPPLSDRPIPAALMPLHDRLEFYLSALQSNTPSIRSLPPHLQSIVALLRFTVLEASRRSDKAKWRLPEVVGVLRAALGTFARWEPEWSSKHSPSDLSNGGAVHGISYREYQFELYPLLTTRNAGLIAALASTMTDSIYLAQSLLLHPELSSADASGSPNTGKTKKSRMIRLPHLTPFVWFNGSTLHSILGGREMGETSTWRWEEREQREFELCLKALGEDMREYVIGWEAASIPRPVNSTVAANGGARPTEGGWRASRDTKRPADNSPQSTRRAAGGGGGVKAMLEKAREEDRRKASSGRFDLLSSLGGAQA